MPYGIIYRALDTTNGKCYVGQTIKTLEKRKKEHLNSKNGCRKICNALLVRGDKFTWEVLQECNDKQSLNDAEGKWVVKFDSVKNGYNLKDGGGARGKLSDETKQIIAEKRRGKKHSEATKQKMRETRLRIWCEPGFKEKMSELHEQLWASTEHRKKMQDAGFTPDNKKGRHFLRKDA
jgi:group I intron endonuclease